MASGEFSRCLPSVMLFLGLYRGSTESRPGPNAEPRARASKLVVVFLPKAEDSSVSRFRHPPPFSRSLRLLLLLLFEQTPYSIHIYDVLGLPTYLRNSACAFRYRRGHTNDLGTTLNASYHENHDYDPYHCPPRTLRTPRHRDILPLRRVLRRNVFRRI